MKRILSVFLFICLCISLCACGAPTSEASPQSEPTEIEQPLSESDLAAEQGPDASLPINVMVLNGTTGFGMAKLIADEKNDETALNYQISVESDASVVTTALINGSCDIAALPTNAAATVYNKTEGGVQMLAINTRGVLYLVVNSENIAVEALSDLSGQTVYAPAQNPTFLFRAILDGAGMDDVTIDNTYAQPADLRTALAAGEIDIAVLPEPMVTIACAANDKLVPVLDLTAEWDSVQPKGSLVQGCVVVRTEFAKEHPAEVAAFLEEYKASIDYLSDDTASAGAVIEESGVFTNGAVAAKAIPNCNICFLTGDDMKAAMDQFCNILYSLEPASIGGAVPDEDFYWLG